MNTERTAQLFEVLASPLRLSIFRILVQAGLTGLVAGEIGKKLAMPSNKLAFHLKALTQTKLIQMTSEGRFNRYHANLPLMLEMIAFLTESCCGEHPEHCAEFRAVSSCSDAVLPPLSCFKKDTE